MHPAPLPPPTLPERGAARATASAMVTTVVVSLPVFLVGALSVQIADEIGFSRSGLGLVVALYFGVSALVSVPAGRLVERYGARVTAWAAIGLAAAAMAAVAGLARGYVSLLLVCGAAGAANALGQLASNLAVARHVPVHRQGFMYGVKQSAVPATTLLAGLAVPVVGLTVGWRWAFVGAAVAALAALPVVPHTDGTGRRRNADLPHRATAALVVIAAGSVFAAGAANALGTFLVDSAVDRGMAPGQAGWTLAVASATGIVCRLGWGWFADRVSHGRILMVVGMLTVGAGGLVLLTLPAPEALVIGALIAFGFGWAWPGVLNFTVVSTHRAAPAAATGITQTGVYLGGCFGPLAFGTIAQTASYPTAWLFGAAAMLVAAILMLVGRRMLVAHQRRTGAVPPAPGTDTESYARPHVADT